jgi:outer membrane immunogenic protein
MKRFLIAIATALFVTPALAADLAAKAPPLAAPAPYSWTGFYVGGNIGYGWNDPDVTFNPNDPVAQALTCGGVAGGTCAPPTSFNTNGPLGGLQAGYNWQFNQYWLLGVETDFDWSRIKGAGASNFHLGGVPPFPSNFQADQNVEWFGTIRGRLGFLPANNLLVYGTGGFAYGRVNENVALNAGSNGVGGAAATNGLFSYACTVAGLNCFLGSSSRTVTGWTAGAGLEYALADNITLKAEYLYINLGNGNGVNVVAQNTGAALIPSSFTASYGTVGFSVVRVGLNYKFN